MIRLADALGIERAEAVGIVELLVHLCAEQTPQGDIGLLTNREIALGIYSSRDPDQLVDALVSTGWLDEDDAHRLLVHDWADHVDDATRKRLSRAALAIYTPRTTADNGGQRRPDSTTQADNGSLPVPVPVPVPEPEPVSDAGRHPPPASAAPHLPADASGNATAVAPLGRLRAAGWGATLQPTTVEQVDLPYTPDVAGYLRRAGPCAVPEQYFAAAVAHWRSIQHDRRRGCSTDWLAMLETWASWHADRCAPCRQAARRSGAGAREPAALPDGVALVRRQLAEDEARFKPLALMTAAVRS
jgi:hypothetical protein